MRQKRFQDKYRLDLYRNGKWMRTVWIKYTTEKNYYQNAGYIIEQKVTKAGRFVFKGLKFVKAVMWHKKCGGWLEFNWANGFCRIYQCNKCNEILVLPTLRQLRERPHLFNHKDMRYVDFG